MNMKWIGGALATGVSLGAAVFAEGAPTNVGELKDLAAWINKRPTDPPRLHVTGKITAPTPRPCYDAVAEYAGDLETNPPVYRIRVTLRQQPGLGACPLWLQDITFQYMQPNYAGKHQKVQVFSERDSKEVAIRIGE
jgi:hypothetical protein